MGRLGRSQASPRLRVVGVHGVGVWGPALAPTAESREQAESGMARKPPPPWCCLSPPQRVGQCVQLRPGPSAPLGEPLGRGLPYPWSSLARTLCGPSTPAGPGWLRLRWGPSGPGVLTYSGESPAGSTPVAPNLLAVPPSRRRRRRGAHPLVATGATAGAWRQPPGCYCPDTFASNPDTDPSPPFTCPLLQGTQLAARLGVPGEEGQAREQACTSA